MIDYPKQAILKYPLREFMGHCEIYCTAACCEKAAFDIHPGLLRRKAIDFNLEGKAGNQLLDQALEQFKSLKRLLLSADIQSQENQIPIWDDENDDLPNYWLEIDGLEDWLRDWEMAFEKAISPVAHES